ncbi:MAG TPA: tetratricopeptide repeat protein, partial [Roseiflexaceae bacterium]|nr:tetratricopeptide repeat protein [Roseiflexaceae bacterium]
MHALAILAADMTQHQAETIGYTAAIGLLAEQRAAAEPAAILQLLHDAGILAIGSERQELGFCHPTLRSFAQALHLVETPPEQWPPAIFSRAWSSTVVLSYSLCDRPERVLRRLLDSDAVALTARCLIDAEPPEQFEQLLNRSGTLTPPLRIMLADAFAAEGLTSVALEQLERAGAEGYDEAGLFGRLGELYSSTEQWRHARVAYEQALLRESGDLRYRHRLGVICARLGELDQAAAALQAVVSVQQERLAEAAYELGNVYLAQGRIEPAIASYREATNAQPGQASYRRSLAGALRRGGRGEQAEALLRQLIDENSSDAAAFAELGQVCADAGRMQEAIRNYLKAVELRPTEAGYYLRIGQLRRARGDVAGARAALQRAAELDSSDAALYFALGETYQQCGEPEGALAAYRHAVRLDPRNETYHRWLGSLLAEKGDHEEAAQALQTALELRPDSAETHAQLAALFWRQELPEQAQDSYRQALALDPNCADYEHDLGMLYFALGKPRAAAPHLHRAVDLDPARADLHYDAGRVAEALKQSDSAAAAYERAATLAPAQAIYARAAGALHLRLGHHTRARLLFAGALRRDRRDPATHYLVGMLHGAMLRVPHAIRALRRAARIGRSAEYYDQLGRMLASAMRFEEACDAFTHALQIAPDNADTLFHYSQALLALGRADEAFATAKQAAALSAGNPSIQHHAGVLALRLGRPREALALLDHAVALDSGLAAAQLDRARVLLQLHQPRAALAAAQAALAISPERAPAALLAGQAALQLGQTDVARELLDRAIASDNQQP